MVEYVLELTVWACLAVMGVDCREEVMIVPVPIRQEGSDVAETERGETQNTSDRVGNRSSQSRFKHNQSKTWLWECTMDIIHVM